jgi:hypothetical protein
MARKTSLTIIRLVLASGTLLLAAACNGRSLSVVALPTLVPTSDAQPHPTVGDISPPPTPLSPSADEQSQAIVLGDDVTFELEGFEIRGSEHLVVYGVLHNQSARQECVRASAMRLYLDSQEYRPDNGLMGEVKPTLNPVRDFIGAFRGQCVPEQSAQPTFAAFEIPMAWETAELSFRDDRQPVALQPPGTDVEIVDALTEMPEATPSVTITATPTVTMTVTPPPSPTPVPETWYITSNANARDCPQTTCSVVTGFIRGQQVQVTGQAEGQTVQGSAIWQRIRYQERDVFVHSSLVSRTPPPTSAPAPRPQPTSPPSGGGAAQPPPVVQPTEPVSQPPTQPPVVAACDCFSGDTLNCGNFNSHAAAQACYDQCIADVGYDVHGLDGNDNDGLACESLP